MNPTLDEINRVTREYVTKYFRDGLFNPSPVFRGIYDKSYRIDRI